MRKTIIALTAMVMTSGVTLADEISSRVVYGDAAPASVAATSPAIDYSTTASVGSTGASASSHGDVTPAPAFGASSRYIYGDAR